MNRKAKSSEMSGKKPANSGKSGANGNVFDPNKYMLKLPKNKKIQLPNGRVRWEKIETDYLPVAPRIAWFRKEHPDWSIVTKAIYFANNAVIMKATVRDADGRTNATARKRETVNGFPDYVEKAETGAVGRALAMCGYETLQAPEFDEGDRLADELAKDGIPSYLEQSRRGGHMWLKHESPVSGLEAKTFGEELLAEFKLEPMEVFPKQEKLRTGPGSLIRLPFSVHRKSDRVYPFVNREDGLPTAGDIHQQITMLRNPKTVSREALDEYTHFALATRRDAAGEKVGDEPGNIWNRIRQAEPAIDFIGRYIELTPTATGGVGYCPFHEDRHKSFGVHEKGNFWRCFAGCGSGSIIDFWMKWRKLEFGEAVRELREMLEV